MSRSYYIFYEQLNSEGEVFLNTAVLVYQCTPQLGQSMLPDNVVFGSFKQNKLVDKLNDLLLEKESPWEVVLDDSIANITVIAQEADAIICAPGLQELFDTGNYPKDHIFYFDLFSYNHLNLDKVVAFLETIHHN